jgi:hypothetical protein
MSFLDRVRTAIERHGDGRTISRTELIRAVNMSARQLDRALAPYLESEEIVEEYIKLDLGGYVKIYRIEKVINYTGVWTPPSLADLDDLLSPPTGPPPED